MLQKTGDNEAWIARSADLQTRSSAFDRSASSLHQIVSARHGYFEDLRTESRSGFRGALVAELAVPSDEFDATLAHLQTLGRVEAVSQAGEGSAVKPASASRRVAARQTSLSRLQKLQRERKGELRDAVALEKDIAQAAETVAETERVQENLQSTVAQAHIRFTLLDDDRAPFHPGMGSSALQIRNSFAGGISAVFSTAALFLGVLLATACRLCFGLPFFFGSRAFSIAGFAAEPQLSCLLPDGISLSKKKRAGRFPFQPLRPEFFRVLRFYEAPFQDLFVAQPQIGNVRRPQPQYVFQRAPHLA
jgi:Domain of unknown function (DUF4349)